MVTFLPYSIDFIPSIIPSHSHTLKSVRLDHVCIIYDRIKNAQTKNGRIDKMISTKDFGIYTVFIQA